MKPATPPRAHRSCSPLPVHLAGKLNGALRMPLDQVWPDLADVVWALCVNGMDQDGVTELRVSPADRGASRVGVFGPGEWTPGRPRDTGGDVVAAARQVRP